MPDGACDYYDERENATNAKHPVDVAYSRMIMSRDDVAEIGRDEGVIEQCSWRLNYEPDCKCYNNATASIDQRSLSIIFDTTLQDETNDDTKC